MLRTELSEEQKRLLSPEDQQNALEALQAFIRDISNPDNFSAPMPPGKADFPPLIGSDAADPEDVATEDKR